MNKMYKWIMLLILLIIVISGGIAVFTIWTGGKGLAVPPLKEMSVVEAVDEAHRLGLKVKIEQIESNLPSGTVLTQWPDPGTKIKQDTTIILKVSKGGNRVPLPDVRGLEYSQALKKLEEAGFQTGDVLRIQDESRPAGTVVAQSPAAPVMVESSRKVDLLISLGQVTQSGQISVPDVLQRQEATARKMLEEAGLAVSNIERVYTQNSPEGMVIAMRPSAGSTLKRGQGVVLQVATLRKPVEEVSSSQVVAIPGASLIEDQATTTVQPDVATQPKSSGTMVPVIPPKSKEKVTATTPSQTSSSTSGGESKTTEVRKTAPVPAGGKIAKVRYQVPPLTRPMPLKIEMVDGNGTRVLLNKEVKGGEYISLETPYVDEGVVTIFLGGEFVWQDRYR